MSALWCPWGRGSFLCSGCIFCFCCFVAALRGPGGGRLFLWGREGRGGYEGGRVDILTPRAARGDELEGGLGLGWAGPGGRGVVLCRPCVGRGSFWCSGYFFLCFSFFCGGPAGPGGRETFFCGAVRGEGDVKRDGWKFSPRGRPRWMSSRVGWAWGWLGLGGRVLFCVGPAVPLGAGVFLVF